jgi:hypothetical protein
VSATSRCAGARCPVERRKPLTSSKPLARKTDLRRGTPLDRGVPLERAEIKRTRPRMSPEEELARKQVTRRSGGMCEMRIPGVCTGRATEWCHRIARGRGGKWLASNGLHGCRACHEATTNTRGRRAEWVRLGYIVRTRGDTTRVRVWFAPVGWVVLNDQGGRSRAEDADLEDDDGEGHTTPRGR